MAKSKATNKSTLEHEISRYYKGHPFSYYSLSSNCPSEEEIKKLIEEIDTDRPKEEDDKRVKLLRTYLGKCVACYVYHIFHSTKDVREEASEEINEINRANKEAFKSFNKDRNLDEFLERPKWPVDPVLSKDFAKLLDIMDAMCVALGRSIIRIKYSGDLSIDSLQRIDNFWGFVGNNVARANEILFPQLDQIYKDLFPQPPVSWARKIEEFLRNNWKWIISKIIELVVKKSSATTQV